MRQMNIADHKLVLVCTLCNSVEGTPSLNFLQECGVLLLLGVRVHKFLTAKYLIVRLCDS